MLRPVRGLLRALALAGASVLALHAGAMAQDRPAQDAPAKDTPAKDLYPEVREDSVVRWLRAPDPDGFRARLEARGLKYELTYTGDLMTNPSGGRRRGTVFSGRTELAVIGDLERLMGWKDATFRINGYHIHGGALSRSYLGNIAAVSNVEGFPAIRLFEAWLEQKFGPSGLFTLRAGQLAADSDFAGSAVAGQFINGTFGWPALHAGNLLSGGPAYPLATPGATLTVKLAEAYKLPLELALGVYNGDTARPGADDPQRRNRHGLDFRLRHGTLWLAEARFALENAERPGTYKLGAWVHSGRFEDRRLGADGLSLADPASNGQALRHRGNHGFYAVADQVLMPAVNERGQVSVFARGFFSPLQDRGLLSWQADAGVVVKGVFDRPGDSFGIAASYMKIARGPAAFDRDFAAFNPGAPIRSHEAAIEANYIFEVRKGFTLQPGVQYVIRPGGGVANPLRPAERMVRNATVFGLRTQIKY